MPLPLGGDFSRSVDRVFNIVKADRRICQHDNGTDVCDKGHKLLFPGTCFNQVTGTFNSTDEVFQISFPICTIDYVSSGFNSGLLFAKDIVSTNSFIESVPSGASMAGNILQVTSTLQAVRDSYNFSISKQGAGIISGLSSQITAATFFQAVPGSVTSFWRMAQFNPGVLPHLPHVFSDLFVYDVYRSYTHINRLVVHMIEALAARFHSTGPKEIYKNIIQTDYYSTISGSVDPCVGDGEPPFITLYNPTISGSEVRPTNQIVDFSLTDAVGGVDISTVYVDLASTTTTGTISLVAAGADQTGGNINITGDPSSYRFTYTHPSPWEYNDTVVVSISGSDLPPIVGGNPFFCGPAAVNTFIGDIPFQVLNLYDLAAEITVIGDVGPPYLVGSSPASGTVGNSVFTSVTTTVTDDLTGVNLSSLYMNIDGTFLVQAGVPTSDETKITGTSQAYTITYTPSVAFSYGVPAVVQVSAEDRVENPSPNIFSAEYSFTFIEDSTLIIENFEPGVGTHHNLDQVDIVVDIRDDTYGVNEDQSFFVINSTIVSGTRTPLASGIQMRYHPPNDFSYDVPIRVTVHGTNNNTIAPVVKESFFTLFFGSRLLFFNDSPYVHGDSVDVFVRARNIELLHKDLSTGYFFTAYTQPTEDMGASIFAINPQKDLSASMVVIAPEHRYGELMTVEFTIEDFNGHILGPFTFTYTIEDRPA